MKRFFLDDTEDHVTEEAIRDGARLAPAKSVLLLTRGMTLLNDVPVCLVRRPMTFNQDVKALRPIPSLDEDFFPYLLLGNRYRLRNLVDLAGHGTGRLNLDELKSLNVAVPPVDEQRAIAHILGTLDDKIELNRRMSETLEAMARALFKSWFVDFDPVRAKMEGRWRPGQSLPGLPTDLYDLFPERLVESELGEIPEGWEVKSLDEVADFVNGAACQKFAADSSTPTLPVVKIRELNQGISEATDRVRAEFPEKYRAGDGDVLFSWSGTLTCRVWTEGPAFVNQHVFRVFSDVYPRWFYLYWTKHHLDRFKAIAAGKATTMGHIKRHHLSEAMTLSPSAKLLRAMTKNMETLVERQVHASLEVGRLAYLRDELLPKLISGTLRVACEDPSVAEGD